VRWLLLKDLQILRRSPLLVALLVLYPLLVALLVGVALSSGPSKPKVAFANLVPPGQAQINLGGQRLDATTYATELFDAVDPVRVKTREQAIEKVRSGEALGALVIPPDVIERLQGTLALGGGDQPTVEVYYSAENPLKRRYVQATIDATLADANKALSAEIFKQAARYLNLIVVGGKLALPVVGDVDILGLRNAQTIIDAAITGLPKDSSSRVALQQVSRFARLAADNLDVSKPILASIGSPVKVEEKAIAGSSSSLDVFGVEVAVMISLMFVTLLLAAGMLALEREEHAFGRLVRGLVSRTGLLAEKIGLAGLCAWALAAAMLAVLVAFLDLGWSRTPAWLLVLAVAALAFAALGVAIGGLAREVRAASLLAFMLALPVAALALVPSGAVGSTLYDLIRIVSGAFPFKPALTALDAAISGGDLLVPLLHLAALTVAFAALARLAVRTSWA
jgi:ABC-2 type transport system permease protein